MSDEYQNIRDFVTALLQRKDDRNPISDESSLVVTGRLDSVDVMEIVVFLEDNYGLDFAERGFDLDDYDSVASIIGIVQEME
jgi:acyl carrier protein